jgi:hypothetical protein
MPRSDLTFIALVVAVVIAAILLSLLFIPLGSLQEFF